MSDISYTGSWVTDPTIAEKLTYEVALRDLSEIVEHPIWFEFDLDQAVRVASKKLNIDFLTLLWDAVFWNADI